MIRLKADKVNLRITEQETLTSGASGIYEALFTFSPEWDGLIKTAVFKAGAKIVSVQLNENLCTVPRDVLEQAEQRLYIGVFGTDGDTVVIPTVYADSGRIQRGADTTGAPASAPTPTVYEQLIQSTHENRIAAEAAAQRAENAAVHSPRIGENGCWQVWDADAGGYADTGIDAGSSGSSSVQPDWNQNDADAADYVKNRPFYVGDLVLTELMPEQTVSFQTDGNSGTASSPVIVYLVEGNAYRVTFDGEQYDCVCKSVSNINYIGNGLAFGQPNSGEPFVYACAGQEIVWMALNGESEHVISLMGITQEVTKIPEDYLPVASDTGYGCVKKSEIITAYSFPAFAPQDEINLAADEFQAGRASIIWDGSKVISAQRRSDTEITIIFAGAPFVTYKYIANGGIYNKNIFETSHSDASVSRIDIYNEDGVCIPIWTEGTRSDNTLHISAQRLELDIYEVLNSKELILMSSTPNSSKRFKITVDDTGTLTTTEV